MLWPTYSLTGDTQRQRLPQVCSCNVPEEPQKLVNTLQLQKVIMSVTFTPPMVDGNFEQFKNFFVLDKESRRCYRRQTSLKKVCQYIEE